MTNPYIKFDIYGLRHLPGHLADNKEWSKLSDLLCDLNFISTKSAAGLTEELVADYNLALTSLPESIKERTIDIGYKRDIKQYVEGLISFARGQKNKFNPIRSSSHKSEEDIRKERRKIQADSSRRNRIQAFAQFVSTESPGFKKFGSNPLNI